MTEILLIVIEQGLLEEWYLPVGKKGAIFLF